MIFYADIGIGEHYFGYENMAKIERSNGISEEEWRERKL